MAAAGNGRVKGWLAIVGCRTTRERNARGTGIGVFRVTEDGPWQEVARLDGVENPSFLAADAAGRTLWAIHGDGTQASAFRIGPGGELALLNTVGTEGRNPVHLALMPGGRHLAVANHWTGTVAVLGIAPDGALLPGPALHPLPGEPGPHRVEQPFAKPHGTHLDPSGRVLLVPDKGLDRIFAFRWDGAALAPAGWAQAREGSGPRHVAIHPSGRWAWSLNELDSTVLAMALDAGAATLRPVQVVPSLPDTFTGFSRAAEVAMPADGGTLYVSNRGHDSIGAFAVDAATGRLAPLGWWPTGGRTPRFIGLTPDDAWLYAANEEDDTITRFRRGADGRLHPEGEAAQTGSPTCILFVPG